MRRGAGALDLRAIPFVGLVTAFFLLVVDSPTQVQIGGLTASAIITVGLIGILSIVLVLDFFAVAVGGTFSPSIEKQYVRGYAAVPWTLYAFSTYALLWLAANPTISGVQNVFCYSLFVVSILLTTTSINRDFSHFRALFIGAVVIASLLFLTERAIGTEFIGSRSYAMTALIGLSLIVPGSGRRGRIRFVSDLILACFLMTTLTLSLSRTATFVGALLLLFLAVRATRGLRLPISLAIASLVAVLALVAVAFYPPLLERFTLGDNASVAGITINTSGRTDLWAVTLDSALESPIWGQGPGSANDVVRAQFWNPAAAHPHNDYLRIFHDFGIVGALLFWSGIAALLIRCWRRAKRTAEPRHWTAVMSLLGILLVALTDNVIVYQFVMVPVGVLTGISLRSSTASCVETHVRTAQALGAEAPESFGADQRGSIYFSQGQ